MSQPYVSGPCYVFTGTGASDALEFLGFSESGGVNLRLISSYSDVMSDFGGEAVPVDSQWMGEQAFVSMTLNRYNELVLQKVLKRRVGSSVVPGSTETNGMGSLMIAQGYAFPLLLYCPYSTQTFQSATITPGYLFGASWLHDDFEVELGVRVKRPRLIFRAIPLWTPTSLSSVLYTTTITSIPAIN